jgi:hypothetical protein
MVDFVKQWQAAKKNWQEQQEVKDLIRQRTLAKKQTRQVDPNLCIEQRISNFDCETWKN